MFYPFCCPDVVFGGFRDHFVGENGAGCFNCLRFVCAVCRSLLTVHLGVIGRLCSVIVALPGHL